MGLAGGLAGGLIGRLLLASGILLSAPLVGHAAQTGAAQQAPTAAAAASGEASSQSVAGLFKALQDQGVPRNIDADKAQSLAPSIQALADAINAQKDKLPLDLLVSIQETSKRKLDFDPDAPRQEWDNGGREMALANLNLMEALVNQLKGRTEHEAWDAMTTLDKDLVWQTRKYPDDQTVEKAAGLWVKHFLAPRKTLVGINKKLSEVNPSYDNYQPARFHMCRAALPLIKTAVDETLVKLALENDPLSRLSHWETLVETQQILEKAAIHSENVLQGKLKAFAQEVSKTLHPALAQMVQKQLMASDDLDERMAMGRVLGLGVKLEGWEEAETAIRRLGLAPDEVIMYGPEMRKADRYGSHIGPLTRLFLDAHRVAVSGDKAVYRGMANWKDASNAAKQCRFNRNAVTAYLMAGQELSRREKRDPYNSTSDMLAFPYAPLIGTMHILTTMGMEQDFYRIAHSPDPAIWGEHAGVLLGMDGGKNPMMSDADYLKHNIDRLKKVLVTGHQAKSPLVSQDSPVEGLFDLYRWNRQYWLLVEKGVKDPHREPDKAQALIDQVSFQQELDSRVEAGWQKFETALLASAPNADMAQEVLAGLGR